MLTKCGKGKIHQKIGKESPSLCHDVDLNVDTVVARSRKRGEKSTLQALEPRALMPERQEKQVQTSKSCCPNTKFSEFHQSALSLPLKRKPPTAGRVSLHPALTGWSRPALSFIFTPLVILPSDYCLVNDNRFIFNPWVAQWCSGYHGSLV